MLAGLHIKNIALIDKADIEFENGLNVLSGETGSGKSVILDCINFVLGSKADKSMVRTGENEAFVSAEFVVNEDSYALGKLKDLDIESDGNIIITRKYSLDGKSSIKINGNAVTAAMLKDVTQSLVDVHGQSEHFFLLDEANQLKVIDDLCGNESVCVRENLSALIDEKRDLNKKIKEIGGDEASREREIDFLSYQIEEIENTKLIVGELDGLIDRRHVLNNAENIIISINEARSAIDDDGGCSDVLNLAIKKISQISQYSAIYVSLLDKMETLRSEVDDVSAAINDVAEDLEFDEDELERVEDRISLIRSVVKKYGGTEEEALKFLGTAKKRLDLLCSSTVLLEKYSTRVADLNKQIFDCCVELTEIRKKYASEFCIRVENELKSLNIPSAKVDVEFKPYDEESADLMCKNGSDKIRFLFSANTGEPLKPLSKVISGGEMSRFMLALKTQIKTDPRDVSTYIFDEIDAGISGYTAKTMAEKFVEISLNTQILAVSHLAQVSAASACQFLIYKEVTEGKTVTRLKKLTEEEKVNEIVRLTGSIDSDAARIHAMELIDEYRH